MFVLCVSSPDAPEFESFFELMFKMHWIVEIKYRKLTVKVFF